jgi:hypothetical protein
MNQTASVFSLALRVLHAGSIVMTSAVEDESSQKLKDSSARKRAGELGSSG